MVLLTGATGFLGSFVLNELVQQDYEVMAVFRSQHPIMEKYSSVRWLRADLGDAASSARLPVPSGGIIHLASTLSSQPIVVSEVDIKGSRRLLTKWGRGPFILLSSTDVYGPLRRIPADESHPLDPSHWYGRGKMACEEQLRSAAKSRKRTDYVIFRPPYILGPHENFPSSLVGKLILHAKRGGDFVLPAGWRSDDARAGHSWVSARDLARCLVATLRIGLTGTYNAASGFVTWKELIGQILALTGGAGRMIFKGNGDRSLALCDEERRFSSEKLARALPLLGATTLKRILADLIENAENQI
jgi:nucleoside-diphosphate-sugar epimerase